MKHYLDTANYTFESPLIQKENDILLTIAIPTYNQPEAFAKTLESIVPQLVPGVEILIRDDSSNTKSEEMVKKYLAQAPIRYFRGEKIGLDEADFFLVEHAKGKYVWWFGDDEMAPGAVSHIMSLLKQYPDISFMWVNSRSKEYGERAVEMGESRFFKDGNEVIEKLADLLNFLSALIFKREDFIPYMAKARAFFRLYPCVFAIYPILSILAKGGRFYYVSKPYVVGKTKDPQVPLFFDPFEVFAVNYFKLFEQFKGKFKEDSWRRSLSKSFQAVWKGIVVSRAKGYAIGLGSPSVRISKLFKPYWDFPEFWVVLPFLLMPRFMIRLCYKAYKFFIPQTKSRLG